MNKKGVEISIKKMMRPTWLASIIVFVFVLSGIYILYFVLGFTPPGWLLVITVGLTLFIIFLNPILGLFLTILSFLLPARIGELNVIFSSLTLVKLCGGLTVIAWLLHKAVLKKGIKSLKVPQTFLILGFGFVAFISTVHARYPEASFTFLESYFFLFILYVLIVDLIDSPKLIDSFSWAIIIGICINAFISVEQWYLGRFSRVIGVVGNPNELGAYCVYAIPLVFYQFESKKPVFLKMISIIIMGFLLFTIILSFSRGAFVSLMVVLVLLLLRSFKKGTNKWTLALLIILVATLFSLAPQSYWARIQAVRIDAGSGRFYIWRDGIRMFLDHPLLGVGPKNFPIYYATSYGKMFRVGRPRAAHNTYLEIAAEMGVIGLFLFLSLIWVVLRDLKRTKSKLNKDKFFQVGNIVEFLEMGFIGLMVWAVFGHFFSISKILFMTSGISVVLKRLLHQANQMHNTL